MAELSSWDIARLVLTVLAAVLYGIVAWVLSRRKVSPDAQLAQRAFIIWWAGLGLLGVYGIVFNAKWGVNVAEMGLNAVLVQLYFIFSGLLVMVWGLSYYMLYLYTGKRDLWVWPAAYFVLLMALIVYLVHGFGGACVYPDDGGCMAPPGWEEGDGRTLSAYEDRPDWIGPVFLLGLVLPPLLAAIMYFLLIFRVRDATSRYRVAVVSGGIILWFGFSAANSLGSLGSPGEANPVRALIGQLLGLLAALLVLAAYFPPAFLRKRFGIERLSLTGD